MGDIGLDNITACSYKEEILKRKILLLALLLLGLLIVGIWSSQFEMLSNRKEFLVVWGKLSNKEDPCSLLVLDPDQKEIKASVIGEPSCNYSQTYIQGKPRLAYVQKDPGIVKIYDITSKGQIVPRLSISLSRVRITSFPQWGEDQYFYISGILNDREQIFRVDSKSGEFVPFIYDDESAVRLPTISPDGNFLVYGKFEGKNNSFECRLDCYNHYSLVNISTGEDKDLLPILEPVVSNPTFTHCRELWSPNGQYLAFNVGCGSEFPQEVIVVDVYNHQITNIISPLVKDSIVDSISWLSNIELLIGKSIEESQSFSYHYFVHSINIDSSQELRLFDEDGLVTRIFEIDTTKDGSRIAGTSIGSTADGQTKSIVIGEIVENNSQLQSELGDRYNSHPMWSSGNDWVAYDFADTTFSYAEDGIGVGIMNVAGEVILETEDAVFKEGGFGWFE